jgi:hypothetical protein
VRPSETFPARPPTTALDHFETIATGSAIVRLRDPKPTFEWLRRRARFCAARQLARPRPAKHASSIAQVDALLGVPVGERRFRYAMLARFRASWTGSGGACDRQVTASVGTPRRSICSMKLGRSSQKAPRSDEPAAGRVGAPVVGGRERGAVAKLSRPAGVPSKARFRSSQSLCVERVAPYRVSEGTLSREPQKFNEDRSDIATNGELPAPIVRGN